MLDELPFINLNAGLVTCQAALQIAFFWKFFEACRIDKSDRKSEKKDVEQNSHNQTGMVYSVKGQIGAHL
jgi:hypothetical protein